MHENEILKQFKERCKNVLHTSCYISRNLCFLICKQISYFIISHLIRLDHLYFECFKDLSLSLLTRQCACVVQGNEQQVVPRDWSV